MTLRDRGLCMWRGVVQLPAWVLVWVLVFLAPANFVAYAMLDTPIGTWTAIAFSFVLVTNLPMFVWLAGITKAMSIPHLIVWIPLQVLIVIQLASGAVPSGSAEFIYGAVILVINGISIVFDVYDTWRWARGDRVVLGRDTARTA